MVDPLSLRPPICSPELLLADLQHEYVGADVSCILFSLLLVYQPLCWGEKISLLTMMLCGCGTVGSHVNTVLHIDDKVANVISMLAPMWYVVLALPIAWMVDNYGVRKSVRPSFQKHSIGSRTLKPLNIDSNLQLNITLSMIRCCFLAVCCCSADFSAVPCLAPNRFPW
jgi:hypothetical protein